MLHNTSELLNLINKKIEKEKIYKNPSKLYEPINYILSLGGKRFRPLLLLMGCEIFKGNIQDALLPSLAVEYFHNFSLIHDDIMDKAPLRRGKKTVHIKWDQNTGILSGDAMLIKSYQYFESLPEDLFKEVLILFNETAIKICEGQQYDINFQEFKNISLKDYIKMITYKTGVVIGSALKIGGIIAKAPSEENQKLYKFGNSLGIAFQLQDDLLDVYADKTKFGKQISGDILENKKTFLFLKSLELGNTETQKELLHWFSSTKFDPKQKIKAVKNIYEKLDIHKITQQEIEKYYQQSICELDKIKVEENQKTELRKLAKTIMNRDY